MTRTATVIDCREQCRKYEAECRQRGESASECKKQRHRCDIACGFK